MRADYQQAGRDRLFGRVIIEARQLRAGCQSIQGEALAQHLPAQVEEQQVGAPGGGNRGQRAFADLAFEHLKLVFQAGDTLFVHFGALAAAQGDVICQQLLVPAVQLGQPRGDGADDRRGGAGALLNLIDPCFNLARGDHVGLPTLYFT